MDSQSSHPQIDLDLLSQSGNINRKLSVLKHRKKQAANDAQLLMNRIALLQKEEERARRKIDQTKERALEILHLKQENEKRILEYIDATSEERNVQRDIQMRNKEQEIESRRARAMNAELIYNKKREDVTSMQHEKRQLTKLMIQDQEKDLRMKQKKREEVRKQEEDAKHRRDEERRENERKVREYYENKAREEENEASRAEKLVKLLEQKEREWISKLQMAQTEQRDAFGHFEAALVHDALPDIEINSRGNSSTKMSSKKGNTNGKRSGGGGGGGTKALGSSSSQASHF